MSNEVAQALLAGWIAGAIAGLGSTAVLLVVAARHPGFAVRLPWQARLGILGIVVANALVIALTLVGLVLGAVWHRTSSDAASALWFPAAVGLGVLAVALLYVMVRGRVRSAEAPAVLGSLVLSAASFALVLPWLASVGT